MSEHTGDLEKRSAPEDSPLDQPEEKITLTGEKSPGVRRIEIISSYLTRTDRVFIFIGVFIIAYAYGLDGTLRYVYQVCAEIRQSHIDTDAFSPLRLQPSTTIPR